jgi:hypothetical protein
MILILSITIRRFLLSSVQIFVSVQGGGRQLPGFSPLSQQVPMYQ